MRNVATAILSAAAFAAIVSACSQKTDQHAQETANSVSWDLNAAAQRAGSAADKATGQLSSAATRIGDHVDNAVNSAGAAIDNGTEKARKDTGAALQRAGKDISKD